MFRSFIFLDEDKLYTYSRQINGTNEAQIKTISKRKSKGFSAGVKGVTINGETETSFNGEVEKDISFDYDLFELQISRLEGEDYFDFVLNDDYDLTTIPGMKLIRLHSCFSIPEEFDVVDLIDRFKPLLMDRIETKNTSEQEALETFLGNASADIPIIVENDDLTIAGKLSAKYLREEYSNLEDYADQAVYLLCKVVGMVRKQTVEVFDPLKDFIRLPRAMRRQMDGDGKSVGIDKIIVEGPVLKVEVVAIYK